MTSTFALLGAVGDVSSKIAFKCQNHLRDKAERDRLAPTTPITCSHVPRNSTISAPFKITNTIRMMIVVSRYIPWRFVDGVASGRWYVHLNFTDRSSVRFNWNVPVCRKKAHTLEQRMLLRNRSKSTMSGKKNTKFACLGKKAHTLEQRMLLRNRSKSTTSGKKNAKFAYSPSRNTVNYK